MATRDAAWIRAVGYVHCAPGFEQNAAVVNGFSDLMVELWGDPRPTWTLGPWATDPRL